MKFDKVSVNELWYGVKTYQGKSDAYSIITPDRHIAENHAKNHGGYVVRVSVIEINELDEGKRKV